MEHITKFLVAFYVRANEVATKAKDRGATATEYALLIAFVVLAIGVGAALFGTAVSDYFGKLATAIGNWASDVA